MKNKPPNKLMALIFFSFVQHYETRDRERFMSFMFDCVTLKVFTQSADL